MSKRYDFDKIIDRKNTNSLKYDFAKERGRAEDILPLWVADMDFQVADEIKEALISKAEHGIFGYSEPKEQYFAAIKGWFEKRHGWAMDTGKIVLSCSVVHALCALINVLTKEGDGVIINQPVYYPFEESIVKNGRKPVVNELVYKDGGYSVDFEDFEEKIVRENVKLYILCSPHNPVGRVWTAKELERLGDICLKHNVFVIADEIHADFTYEGYKHIVFPTVKKEFESICAVCTAPTKTFNLAGLHNANIYIHDDAVRAAYKRELTRQGYSQSNIMGIVAAQAAYQKGGEWLDQLKAYLQSNLDFLREFLKVRLPKVKLVEPQGTYLVWLDFSALGLDDKGLNELVEKKAGLWLDAGYIFGKGGSGFERINVACPRAVLKEALGRLERAVKSI